MDQLQGLRILVIENDVPRSTTQGFDSDCPGSGFTLDEQLLTDYYDCSTNTNVHLAFNHYFNNLTTDSCHVEVRNGSTGAWTVVAAYYADTSASEDYDITSYIGTGDSGSL